jgi:hypothetical protein
MFNDLKCDNLEIAKELIHDKNIHIYLSDTEEIKSKFKIGNVVIHLPKTYNWFQKKMYKLFFNIDLEEGDNYDKN